MRWWLPSSWSGPTTSRKAWLWLALLVALAAALPYALPRLLDSTPPDKQLATAAEVGETRYRQSCASCHGPQGAGHLYPGAPALDASEHAWHHSDAQIIRLMRSGGPSMPAVAGRWSDDDVAAVMAYMKSWWTLEQRQNQVGTIGE